MVKLEVQSLQHFPRFRRRVKMKIKHLEHVVHRIQRELAEERVRLRHLEGEVHELKGRIPGRMFIEGQIVALEQQIRFIRQALESGLAANPALRSFFEQHKGSTVTVVTPSGSLTGTVQIAGINAVQLVEQNSDVVIVPYSKISAVYA